MTEEGQNIDGITHRVCQEHYQRQGQRKGGEQTGEEVSEIGSRRGYAGAKRDMGSRLRAERQQAQGRAVEAGRSGCFSRWKGAPISEEKGENQVRK